MLIGLQFTVPFQPELPEAPDLVPRHTRSTLEPVVQTYPAILERPIFAEDRLPMMEMLQGYSLLGTGIAGPRSTAIVQAGAGPMTRVKPGDRIGRWKVASIADAKLYLTGDKERRMLRLKGSSASTSAIGGVIRMQTAPYTVNGKIVR
jgi:hypothetical protein